jgi:hypothetical protein
MIYYIYFMVLFTLEHPWPIFQKSARRICIAAAALVALLAVVAMIATDENQWPKKDVHVHVHDDEEGLLCG